MKLRRFARDCERGLELEGKVPPDLVGVYLRALGLSQVPSDLTDLEPPVHSLHFLLRSLDKECTSQRPAKIARHHGECGSGSQPEQRN